MRKYKYILLTALTVFVALAAALGVWIFTLSEEIQVKLKTKKFQPPTQYYSRGTQWIPGSKISKHDVIQYLSSSGYRSRDKEQKLFPGDFVELTHEDCQKWLQDNLSTDVLSCVAFSPKTSDDPQMQGKSLQMLGWNVDNLLIETRTGNPLSPSSRAETEPQLIAQYIGTDPVLQTTMALGEMPAMCLNAVLSIEDSRYLDHFGVSLTGIARAAIKNAIGHGLRQGGSTITQQLVKNYYLSSEKTMKRKITEILMSVILENYASKDEILETYLNIIYLGQKGPFQIRGFGAASEYYFSKPIANLDLSECALLAAIVNSPGLFDPFHKQANALKRRHMVLDKMRELGHITEAEEKEALDAPLPVSTGAQISETAPYYLDAINKQLKSLDLLQPGIKVYSGLDPQFQESAQIAVRENLDRLETQNKKIIKLKEAGHVLEGALLSVDNETGLYTTIVGGRGFKRTQFNRAVDGHRQIGSIMKPLVYLTALRLGQVEGKPFDPVSLVKDEKFTVKSGRQSWSPENYEHDFNGDVPAYFALKNSLNAATAALGIAVGLGNVIQTARSLGIKSDLQEVPSLSLGAFELYPTEVAEAYTTLSQMGRSRHLSFIRSVLSPEGKILFRYSPESSPALEPAPVASLVSMLKQTIQSGTAKAIMSRGFTQPAAGKTGTTSDYRDAWFAGFTPDLTTVVWVGYDDNTSHGLTGASGAVPIWTDFMKSVSPHYTSTDFTWPPNTEVQPWTEKEETIDLVFEKNHPKSR